MNSSEFVFHYENKELKTGQIYFKESPGVNVHTCPLTKKGEVPILHPALLHLSTLPDTAAMLPMH